MKTSASKSSVTPVRITCGRAIIHGELAVPDEAEGLVIFAHATHGGWTNSKNWPIAWKLHQNHYATLMLDLLTPEEAELENAKGFLRLAVPLLTQRLVAATHWAIKQERLERLDYAYFASEAAAAAALEAAATLRTPSAVICRAARTDLTSPEAGRLETPVLLIAGEKDRRTLRWNDEFVADSRATRRLEIVKGATHSFPKEGAIPQVARLTVDWVKSHLRGELQGPEGTWARH